MSTPDAKSINAAYLRSCEVYKQHSEEAEKHPRHRKVKRFTETLEKIRDSTDISFTSENWGICIRKGQMPSLEMAFRAAKNAAIQSLESTLTTLQNRIIKDLKSTKAEATSESDHYAIAIRSSEASIKKGAHPITGFYTGLLIGKKIDSSMVYEQTAMYTTIRGARIVAMELLKIENTALVEMVSAKEVEQTIKDYWSRKDGTS